MPFVQLWYGCAWLHPKEQIAYIDQRANIHASVLSEVPSANLVC